MLTCCRDENCLVFSISKEFCQKIDKFLTDYDSPIKAHLLETTILPSDGGSYDYRLNFSGNSKCILTVANSWTGTVGKFILNVEENDKVIDLLETRFYNFYNYLENNRQIITDLTFRIAGGEYQSLKQWDHWREKDYIANRYQYSFSYSSLGYYAQIVVDCRSGNRIDLTDYDYW